MSTEEKDEEVEESALNTFFGRRSPFITQLLLYKYMFEASQRWSPPTVENIMQKIAEFNNPPPDIKIAEVSEEDVNQRRIPAITISAFWNMELPMPCVEISEKVMKTLE